MGARRNIHFPHRSSNARDHKPNIGPIDGMDSQPASPTREQNGDAVRLRSDQAGKGEANGIGQTAQEPPPQSEHDKKRQTFITRTIWTFVMIAFFFVSMFAGHIYIIVIVTAVQIVSFKEVIAIANVPSKAKNLRFTRSLNWYFLGTVMYYLYGESVIYYFKHIVLVDKVLLPFVTHHRFISFMLYVIGKSKDP